MNFFQWKRGSTRMKITKKEHDTTDTQSLVPKKNYAPGKFDAASVNSCFEVRKVKSISDPFNSGFWSKPTTYSSKGFLLACIVSKPLLKGNLDLGGSLVSNSPWNSVSCETLSHFIEIFSNSLFHFTVWSVLSFSYLGFQGIEFPFDPFHAEV